MKLTKEQEEKLKKDLEYYNKTCQFQCQECLARFTGMKAVHKHVDEYKHHSFKDSNGFGTGVLCVG